MAPMTFSSTSNLSSGNRWRKITESENGLSRHKSALAPFEDCDEEKDSDLRVGCDNGKSSGQLEEGGPPTPSHEVMSIRSASAMFMLNSMVRSVVGEDGEWHN